MNAENTIKITFPALSRNEALARSVISAFAAQLDPTVEELSDIRSAVSEAITNAIVHGYRGEKGDVDMCAGFDGNRNLYIKIKDRGCGIKNVEQAMTPLFTTAPEGERAGLGFAVRAGLHCAPLAHESAGTLQTGTVRVSFGPDACDRQTDAFLRAARSLTGAGARPS